MTPILPHQRQRCTAALLACLMAVIAVAVAVTAVAATTTTTAPTASRDGPVASVHASATTSATTSAATFTAVAAAPSSPRFAVYGYIPEYRHNRFPYADVFAHGLTHLIFFSAEVDPETGGLSQAAERLPAAAAAGGGGGGHGIEDEYERSEWGAIRSAADAHAVKLMLCVGGGGRSAGFPAMVADPYRRAVFIAELNAFLIGRRLDGVDINWEYPVGETQWRHFARFMQELRSTLGHARIWDEFENETTSGGGGGGGGTSSSSAPRALLLPPPPSDVTGPGMEAEQRRLVALWQSQQRTRRGASLADRATANHKTKHSSDHRSRDRAPPLPLPQPQPQPQQRQRITNHRVRLRAMTVTMAVHPHPQIAALLLELNILPWIDHLHWMAYDYTAQGKPHSAVAYAEHVLTDRYIGALNTPGVAPPSLLSSDNSGSGGGGGQGPPPLQPQARRVAEAVEARRAAVTQSGTATTDPTTTPTTTDASNRRKLTLGIPFYGRHMGELQLPAETYEHLSRFIAQWARSQRHGWWEAVANNTNGGGGLDGQERRRTAAASIEAALKVKNEYGGYGFSSHRDVQAKMRLARRLGLGGIMAWELGQDQLPPSERPLALMRAVAEQLAVWRREEKEEGEEVGDSRNGKEGKTSPQPPPPQKQRAPLVNASVAAAAGNGEERKETDKRVDGTPPPPQSSSSAVPAVPLDTDVEDL